MDDCSIWELSAAVAGWAEANGAGETKTTHPTAEEHDALMAKYAD